MAAADAAFTAAATGAGLTAGASARCSDRSGTRIRRKVPDTRKATMATMLASRSVERAAPPAGAESWGNTVNPAMAV